MKKASLQSEVLKTGGQQMSFVSLCREILTRFIEERFPTVVEGLVSFVLLVAVLVRTVYGLST